MADVVYTVNIKKLSSTHNATSDIYEEATTFRLPKKGDSFFFRQNYLPVVTTPVLSMKQEGDTIVIATENSIYEIEILSQEEI